MARKSLSCMAACEKALIRIEQHGDFWIAHVDGAEVIDCGLTRRFDSEVEALKAALAKIR